MSRKPMLSEMDGDHLSETVGMYQGAWDKGAGSQARMAGGAKTPNLPILGALVCHCGLPEGHGGEHEPRPPVALPKPLGHACVYADGECWRDREVLAPRCLMCGRAKPQDA